nr:MAG TPA: hypothetical protein [Crassvirales sp.]
MIIKVIFKLCRILLMKILNISDKLKQIMEPYYMTVKHLMNR